MDMQTIWNENRVILRGTAAAEPVLSHENHGPNQCDCGGFGAGALSGGGGDDLGGGRGGPFLQ